MSMAIWAEFRLQDGTIISDKTDKHQMLEYMASLDDLCKEFDLTLLSELFDYPETMDDLDGDDLERLQEQEPLHDFDTRAWFAPREAIYIMDTLLDSLTDQPELLNAPARHVRELMAEFEQCLNFAQEALDQESEQFHLILLM